MLITANDASDQDPVSFRLSTRKEMTSPWKLVLDVARIPEVANPRPAEVGPFNFVASGEIKKMLENIVMTLFYHNCSLYLPFLSGHVQTWCLANNLYN